MGVTKQYLKYVPSGMFSLIAGIKSNIVSVEFNGQKGHCCAVGASEKILVWDLRKSEQVIVIEGDKSEVTALTASSRGKRTTLAAGYADGTIKVYSLPSGECLVTLQGHRSGVTVLNYDKDATRLVSGSKDTEVIVWDIVNECGLFRLRGHKGIITQASFMKTHNILITSSKDTFVKFWDLDTQHCFKTLVGHRHEVYGFAFNADETALVTGAADNELRIFELLFSDEVPSEQVGLAVSAKKQRVTGSAAATEDGDGEDADVAKADMVTVDDTAAADKEEDDTLQCIAKGSVRRSGRGRVVSLGVSSCAHFIGCHGTDNLLEIFTFRSGEELEKIRQKKLKKQRKRLREQGTDDNQPLSVEMTANDRLKRCAAVRSSAKLSSFCFAADAAKGSNTVSCLLNNNSLELYTIAAAAAAGDGTSATAEPTADLVAALSSRLHGAGHRTDVRALAFSSDCMAVLSGSGEAVKVWNRASLKCIRTMECDYALCCLFAPGDRYAVVGTKTGKLQVFDIAAGTLIESLAAHTGAVWSLCMTATRNGIVTGSADHDVKFFDFELAPTESGTGRQLTLLHSKTLKMSEDVTCVRCSSDQRLLAVALLDNTVKIFFADTLKFFLSLYGHKLPVLSMDISTDGSLIVTASADRNLKVWGLDFGDCHRSIFAHEDSIMGVQFVPKTHMAFSCGKDGRVKHWDLDSFEHVATLSGGPQNTEVWAVAVAPNAAYVVASAHDRSLRIWEKTSETLVLEEEKETAREKEYEEEALAHQEATPVAGEASGGEVALAGKKTLETVRSTERIMEAIDVYRTESVKLAEHAAACKSGVKVAPLVPHPLLQAYDASSPERFVLLILRKVPSSELEEALLTLPFSYVTDLLELLCRYIDLLLEVELSCRCLLFLLRIHHGQITTNQLLLPAIDKLNATTGQRVDELKDIVGFNMAALQYLQQQLEAKDAVGLFTDATDRFKKQRKKKKKLLTLAS